MDYKYVAYTTDRIIHGSVLASGEEEATAIIDSQGYHLLKLEQVKSFGFSFKKLFPSMYKVKLDDIIIFSRQLKLLIGSGSDIVTSLELLQEQISNAGFKKVINNLISDIRSGMRVADAMAKYPEVFPHIYCRSVGVGEQTGEMGMMLEQIADYLERESTKQKGLKSALAYPIVVASVAIVVAGVIAIFVLPTLQNLYSTLNADLPTFTKIFMAGANALRKNILPIIGMIATVVIGSNIYLRTSAGKYQKDKWALTLPMVGLINRLKEMSYCCRTMAVLFRSGLTSTEIMDIVIDSTNNRLMHQALVDVKQGMLKGEGIAKPMSDNKLFLPMMVQMVKIGEETGGLGDTLVVVAETYDADAQAKTKVFVRFIQTALTMGITVMVGAVVMVMMMSMYGIYGQVKMG